MSESNWSSSRAPQPRVSIFGAEHRALTLGIVSVVLLVAFEAMAVATAMPVAARDLEALDLYAWAFSAFYIAALVGMVAAGELSDRRGPKLPFLLGAGSFGSGLLMAGSAPSMAVLVGARVMQGFGGGLMIVVLYVIVARAYPEEMRPRVFAAISSCWVLPSIVGPVIAGWLAEHASWRLVFLVVAPLIVPAVALMLPRVRHLGCPAAEAVIPRRGRVQLAVVAALGAATLQYAGQRLELVSIPLALAGLALMAGSVPRLLPRGTLRAGRGLPTVVLMRGVLAACFFGAEAFVPLMLVTERGLSPALAGLSLTGAALGWATGSWLQGRPSTRVPRHHLVQGGSSLVALGIGLLVVATVPTVPVVVAVLGWALAGLGMGLAMASISVLVLALSEPGAQGSNSAALQVSDSLGSVLLIGAGGAIYAGLRSGAGQDAAVFGLLFAVMALMAVLGAVIGGRVRVPRPSPRACEHGTSLTDRNRGPGMSPAGRL